MLIHAPKMELLGLDPGAVSSRSPQGTSLHANTSYDLQNRSLDAGRREPRNKVKKV